MKPDKKRRSDLFHDTVPEQGRVRFHCRFQTAVYECYRRHPRHLSRAIRQVLREFRKVLRGGMLDLSRRSRFIGRPDTGDKVELHVQLAVADKDLLEKMAFALRSSQSEVLRMALEWHMEAIRMQSRRAVFYRARRKWHHRRPQPRLYTMRFSFWRTGRLLEWQFPPPSDIETAFRTIADRDASRFYKRSSFKKGGET